ncbi:MAG: Cache 3/Cache 2 fusion domain-containing protein [Saprospiraceae bacterium]|nr:Cache 3/Cache 2 fusion domain-containing protein [Saprospiraceae bacterium]
MPHKLELGIKSLLHGLDEALYSYQQTIDELVSDGILTEQRGKEKIRAYHKRMLESCSYIDNDPDHLQVDRNKRFDLLDEIKKVGWRLQFNPDDESVNDSFGAYLLYKRKKAMKELQDASIIANKLLRDAGTIEKNEMESFTMTVSNQNTLETHEVKLSNLILGNTSIHFDYSLVDKIEEKTNFQATIFQRIPEGFVRIATNIRTLNNERAIGSYIPSESKVVQTILSGEVYEGSAFVLNQWCLSIYCPLYIGEEIEGMLYVGRRESIEFLPSSDISNARVQNMVDELRKAGAFDLEDNKDITGKFIQILNTLPEQASDPILNMGLKEAVALMAQERELKLQSTSKNKELRSLDVIVEYIKNNLSDEISIEELADLSFMSKASFHRHFKTKYNTSPNVFINKTRLKKAHEMLESNNQQSIQDICQEVGFKNPSYFIKLFKQFYGVTPKKYLMQLKEK